MIEYKCQDCHWNQEEFHSEDIMIGVIGRLKLYIHQVNCGIAGGDEKHLHSRIIKADPVGHQIQISSRVREGE